MSIKSEIQEPMVATELQPALNALLQLTEHSPPLNGANLGFYRKRARVGSSKPLDNVPFEVVEVADGANYRRFRLWLININADGPARPAILHFHGGGLVMGNCQNSLPRMQSLAKALNCVVVSVEYGLAPEVRPDEAQLQHQAALNWLKVHADTLAINTSRISLLGVSAGGCHAVNLALRCAENKLIDLAGMALLYPMLDDKTGSTVMPPAHQGQYLWTAEQNYYGWRSFLGKAPGSDKIPSHHVPARANTLSGLPSTFIAVGELDLFYAENCSFAERLAATGIATELYTVPGAFHAFESIAPQSQLAIEFNQRLLQALERYCN
ncbi:alpha/beta hydrolase [Alteromonas sp. ZYF713]|nr:alpha/beta hydrolase [Alteromonas sp. ZYF713]